MVFGAEADSCRSASSGPQGSEFVRRSQNLVIRRRGAAGRSGGRKESEAGAEEFQVGHPPHAIRFTGRPPTQTESEVWTVFAPTLTRDQSLDHHGHFNLFLAGRVEFTPGEFTARFAADDTGLIDFRTADEEERHFTHCKHPTKAFRCMKIDWSQLVGSAGARVSPGEEWTRLPETATRTGRAGYQTVPQPPAPLR